MSLEHVELTLVDSMEDVVTLLQWLGRRRPYHAIAVDTETSGLDRYSDHIRLCQVGDDAHGFAFAWDRWRGLFEDIVRRWDGGYILHNAPFDVGFFSHAGVELPRHRIDDTLVQARINEPHMSAALKSQATRHVDSAAASLQGELTGTKWTWATVPIDYQPYWCVPKTTEILTRSGWKKWDAIVVDNDETLGYENGELRWTKITGVHTPGVAPVVRFGNKHWSTLCTPNHRWVMQKGDDIAVHSLNKGWFGTTHLIRSAPAEGGSSSLTPNEAAILAWVLSDGNFQWQRPETQSSPWVMIKQSTKKYANEIRKLLATEGCLGREWVHPSERDQEHFNIRFGVIAGYFTALWHKAGLAKYGVKSSAFRNCDISLIELVTSLTPEARAAWNDAWIKAEGSRGKNDLKQNRGAKLDAVMLSLYMDGYAVTASTWSREDVKCVGVHYTKRNPTPQKTHYIPAGTTDVWCPTTDNSTWTARDENGNIFVTGNTYAALDPVLTYHLHMHHHPIVMRDAPRSYEIEMPILWIVERMKENGAFVDVEFARRNLDRFTTYCREVADWCKSVYGVNPGSNDEVIQLLQSEGVTFEKRTKGGALSLDSDVLDDIDHPLAQAVLQRRKAQKMASTYLKFYVERSDADQLIHPSFNSLGARTGRMSSSDPNLQNLPRRGTNKFGDVIRNCIKTRYGDDWSIKADGDSVSQAFMNATDSARGSLIMCDYSQIEMRMMAHFAQERGMIEAFKTEGDFFVNLARQIFQDDTITKKDKRRQITKNAGYSRIYGSGVRKFSLTAGIPETQGREFMNRWNAMYPGVNAFSEQIINTALQRRAETGVSSANSPLTNRLLVTDAHTEYKLVNYVVQGAAAEVNKMKLIELDAAGLGDWMFGTVHDEVLFDVPGDHVIDVVHTVLDIMNDDALLDVPIEADASFGERWGEKTEWPK